MIVQLGVLIHGRAREILPLHISLSSNYQKTVVAVAQLIRHFIEAILM